MKDLATLALLRLPTCICFAGAIYLLSIGITSGWGLVNLRWHLVLWW